MNEPVHYARAVALLLCAATLGPTNPASAQADAEPAYESSFVEVRGIRMHYLDFGGSGLPVIFIHGDHDNARSFADFAPRFADGFRALALDRRGFGESENVDWGNGTVAQAEDLVGFMDALALQRAVLIGNVAGPPTGMMVYLGEHHPDRLAGIVFLTHMTPEVASSRDPATDEFWDMASRTACDWDEETRQRLIQRDGYRPHFIDDPDFRIDVPALSLANEEGTRYPAGFDFVGILLQHVETGDWCDATAKAYFSALAADTARAIELRSRLGDLSGAANLSAFERAFGSRMSIVRLNVPAVSGYEYQQAPDLIYPHIREFLESLEPERGPAAVNVSQTVVATGMDTVQVGPPTGDSEADRASILAALAEVEPGGIVQFAPGTYLIGPIISVKVPRVTLLGHPDGTTLRGCDPDDMGTREYAMAHCNGLELAGGHQTVRGLTFEYAYWALHLGCCFGERAMLRAPDGTLVEGPAIYRTEGGHLVEGNTLRRSASGIRMNGDWTEPAVVRGNRFVDNWHSVSINGNTVHLLDNDFSVPEPERVPFYEFPNDAVQVAPTLPLQGVSDTMPRGCAHNVVAGNRIEGSKNGISIMVWEPGTSCRNNVIRDNTITVRRARVPSPENFTMIDDSDSTFVGNPLSLLNFPEAFGQNERGQESAIEDNLIEGNRIIGAEGLGIEVLHASGNRFVNNTISGIAVRTPFPGNTMTTPLGQPAPWRQANGSAIWISPGSDGNEIVGNTFEEIASFAVMVEGDSNRIELPSASDTVRDLGTGNRIIRRGGSSDQDRGGPAPDTTRYVEIVDGHTLGEWRTWQEDPDTRGYSSDRYFGFERTERLTLDDAGLPVRLEASGRISDGVPWFERFERKEATTRWITPMARDSAHVSGPAFYAAVHPAHDIGVLARALLRQESGTVPLLPAREARLEALSERTIEVDDSRRTVRLYAVHGLDLLPMYVWLDQDGTTFADEWSVLAGWEPTFGKLRAAVDDALEDHSRTLARELAPPERNRPLAIRGARVFDPETGQVRESTTIVVEDDRIAAVGADGAVVVPMDAEVIDAAEQMVLPGLWDMHTHLRVPAELDPVYDRGGELLHLAAGVTTVRDMGSRVQSLVALRSAIDRGDAIGPRIIGAGYIDGADVPNDGVGFYVGTEEEARTAVDRYAELGFAQIKIYASLPPELLELVVARAKEHGMRVSGHITEYLTTRDAVEAGFDEIQHLWWLLWAIPWTNEQALAAGETRETWHQVFAALMPESKPVRQTVELLAERAVAVDATLGYFTSESSPPEFIAGVVDRLPPPVQRRVRHKVVQPNYFPRSPLARPAREQALANMFAMLPMLHGAGVPLLVGTDLWPGFGLHHEMELFVRAGIPAPDVLELATLGAARVMGMDDELGSVEPGKLADLILVDGDPTANISDIRRVVMVIKNGRVYDPAAIYGVLGIRPCCEHQEVGQ